MRTALLTGATGSLGIRLLGELCARGRFDRIFCLTRRRIGQSGRQRLEACAYRHGVTLSAAVVAVDGDLGAPHLGLAPDDEAQLVRAMTHLFHAAADIRFNQPLDVIRRSNLDGTRALLDLCARARARHGRFSRFVHVGTAYVSRPRRGLAEERVLAPRREFRNSYEQSKFEAEALVRARRGEVPSVIVRPSIIWVEDRDGRMPQRSAAYPLLKLHAQWPFRFLPVFANTLDIVPVGFVARAIAALGLDDDSEGGCFHLAAGADGALTLWRFCALLDEAFGALGHPRQHVRLPPWLSHACLPLWRGAMLRRMRGRAAWDAYLPYLEHRNPRFDIAAARAALTRAGIAIPTSEAIVRDSLPRVLAELTGRTRTRMTGAAVASAIAHR